ncbi:hypothetical protein N866_03270 [Actinotalea ferrariae CF5-4]|uniref:Uncharacterized protein n=1 Tax=Actinotalea ferrariae CF5-4 TaxID=948458 RepID=A0A021W0P6_9CELL|nr:hypothetical protein [Actinotalea ferrariae]EYR64877.1 hypothetical protein N866_03270 [Actinotalea ferrariae CF5-4]
MSTKLHHGYRLAEGVDPFDFIATVRAHIDPVRDRADARILAERTIDIIDKAAVRGAVTHAGTDLAALMKTPLISAYMAYEEEQAELKDTDRRQDPNRFELSIGRDSVSGRHAVLLFAEESSLVEAFRTLPEVEQYGYWNNTDRPDDVTKAQWEDRRAFWDRVLPGYTAPVVAMMSWRLRGTYDGAMTGLVANRSPLILEELPDLDRRARRAAHSAVADAAVRALPDRNEMNAVWRVVSRSFDTTQFPEVVDAAAALLPAEVDMDLLLGDRPLLIDDVDTKRAAFLGLAEAAGKRLLQAEQGED